MSQESRTINQKIADLEQMVKWFESDQFTPEEATTKFHLAEKLASDINDELDKFKNEVNIIKQKFSEGA